MKIAKTRATTAEWQSAYPWHFGGAIPPGSGQVLGIDRIAGDCPFGLDPFTLLESGIAQNPNCVIAGAPANGKSALVKQMLWWAVGAFGGRFVATDVKSEYRALAGALKVPVLDLHPGGDNQINPLDEPAGRLEFVRALASLCVERSLEPVEGAALAAVLRALPDEPVLPDVVRVLREMPARVLDELGISSEDQALAATQALRFGLGELLNGSLVGMFSGRSNVNLADSPRGFVVDVSRCGSDDRVLRFALLAGQRAVDQMVNSSPGRTYVVNDEAWRLATTAEGVRWMQHSFKLGRQQAKANIIVVHRLSEIGAQADGVVGQVASRLVSDADIHILFRQGDQLDATDTVERLGLPRATHDALARLPAHRCLIHVRGRLALLDVILSRALAGLAETNTAIREASVA